ncbi:MAG: pectinesterase family protein [Bacilli bacterium]
MKTIRVGKNEKIKSINEAINLANKGSTILLVDDYYFEKVVVNKPNLTITSENNSIISYNDYARKIHNDGREYVTFRTYTMLIKAPHVTLSNLTIENTAGEGHIVGQAVALHLYADDINLINCTLKAHQDTIFLGPLSPDLIERYIDLLPEDERIYEGQFHHTLKNCTICGTVDFIFGGSNAKFIDCTIISLPTPKTTYIVAPNHNKEIKNGFEFINCKILKDKNTLENSVYLARPWREYGLVNFKNCYLDNHIIKEGFSIWEGTDRHINCRFYEENSKGPGANNKERISWSHIK